MGARRAKEATSACSALTKIIFILLDPCRRAEIGVVDVGFFALTTSRTPMPNYVTPRCGARLTLAGCVRHLSPPLSLLPPSPVPTSPPPSLVKSVDRGNHPRGGAEQALAETHLRRRKVLAPDLAGARRSPVTDRSEWHPQGVNHVASSVVPMHPLLGGVSRPRHDVRSHPPVRAI